VAILNLCVPPIGGGADGVRMKATPNHRVHSCAALVIAPGNKHCVARRIRRRAVRLRTLSISSGRGVGLELA
jgi:hypothetical protein